MSSLIDLVQADYTGMTLFAKNPELWNGKDSGPLGLYPYARKPYNDQAVIAATLQYYLVGAISRAQFALPRQTPRELLSWIEETLYISRPPLLCYDNNEADSYVNLFNTLPAQSLIMMHPYERIASDRYAVPPNVLFSCNNKADLHLFTDTLPRRQIMYRREELESFNPPYVLKKIAGGGGDGVQIIRAREDTLKLQLTTGEAFVVEEYIDAQVNYGIHYYISKSGRIEVVGHNRQSISQESVALAKYFSNEEPPQPLNKIGQTACQKLATFGYWGFVGLDVLQDRAGAYYVIDCNARYTASIPVYLLQHNGNIPKRNVSIRHNTVSAETAVGAIMKVKNRDQHVYSLSHPKFDRRGLFRVSKEARFRYFAFSFPSY